MARNNGAKWRKIADIDPLAHKPALCRCIHSAYWRTRSSFDFISPALGSISAILCQREVRTPACEDIIELDRIVKQYGDNTVLDNISLSIGTGEVVSILGPSGCGKTTLLNVLLGITDATDGRIVCDGEDITNVPMEKRGFNIVFQDYALFPNLNAYENVTYGLRNNPGISSQEEVDELVELLGLREHLTKKISQLSGGQKQRVALARTLVMKPRLLLLDEPLSALDGVIKESIEQKIKQIVEQYQLTTVMVTHDPEEALTMSDKALILNGGHIAQYATPDEIVNAPASQFVQDFILRQWPSSATTSSHCSAPWPPPASALRKGASC